MNDFKAYRIRVPFRHAIGLQVWVRPLPKGLRRKLISIIRGMAVLWFEAAMVIDHVSLGIGVAGFTVTLTIGWRWLAVDIDTPVVTLYGYLERWTVLNDLVPYPAEGE